MPIFTAPLQKYDKLLEGVKDHLLDVGVTEHNIMKALKCKTLGTELAHAYTSRVKKYTNIRAATV